MLQKCKKCFDTFFFSCSKEQGNSWIFKVALFQDIFRSVELANIVLLFSMCGAHIDGYAANAATTVGVGEGKITFPDLSLRKDFLIDITAE